MTIKELRESKGLSQGKFAESIGIGRTAIVGYEKGKFKPSPAVVEKIKEVYGVDIAAPAPTEEKKTAKRGKKKAEAAPAVEEQPAPTKRGGRKKAAPTVEETTPAVEEKVEAAETNIAAAIKELRTGRGLSQKAFAESIGLKTNTVSAYEQGRIKPSEAVMAKIREVYGAFEAAAATTETVPVVEEKKPAAKKPAKRGKKDEATPAVEEKKTTKRGKKAEATPIVEEEKPVEEKKPTKRGSAKKAEAAVKVVIQSPMGGSITPEEIIKKTGLVDTVYIRVDENKAYWVRGEETGSVDLW